MFWFGCLMVGLVLLLVILYYSPVRIELLIEKEEKKDRAEIVIHALFGLIRFKIEIPVANWEGFSKGLTLKTNEKSTMQQKRKRIAINQAFLKKMHHWYQTALVRFQDFKQTIRMFISKVTCEKLVWRTSMGTGDAAEAGVLTGVLWMIKTNLLSRLGRYIRWEREPELYVEPVFHHLIFQTYFHSIIRFRVGHVIHVIIRLFKEMRQGRERHWQPNIPYKV